MVVAKTLIFGFVKNYFGVALIEKSCLGPETILCFSSKTCVIGSEEELFLILSHEWMMQQVRASKSVDKLFDSIIL